MKKSALKRSTYRLKRVGIRRRSKKREAAYSGPLGRRAFVKAYLEQWQYCVVGLQNKETASLCTGDSKDVHEKISRSALGAIVPGEKATQQGQVFFTVCRACHDFLHSHPKWAKEQGFLV